MMTARGVGRWTVRGLASAALAVPVGMSAQGRCEHRDVQEMRGPAAGELRVDAGAGSLAITGREGLDEVRVTATLCASSRERLAELSVGLDGDRLETDYPGGSWMGRGYARIDLEVQVPLGTDVDVEDSSGSVAVSDVGAVRIEDGSGSMQVRRARSVVVDDGSGSLRIEDVDGDVEVGDGSGSMEISDVAGDVRVSDGSGSIAIRSVGGSVRVDGMGSGGLAVQDVAGDLVVKGGRRERIRHSNVRGELDLPPARRKGRKE